METIKEISYKEAIDFLLPKHYSGRKPHIAIAFGLYRDNILQAVCTFGKPASHSLCKGICGEEYANKVYELNRLCRLDTYDKPLSQFVGACLRNLKVNNWIIVSYSDMAMTHHGYIYQACNFLYTGATKSRTDFYSGEKHSRHSRPVEGLRQFRSSKHRYVYICGDKRFKKKILEVLNYKVMPYPKGDNKNYTLGEYLKPIIIKEEQKVERN